MRPVATIVTELEMLEAILTRDVPETGRCGRTLATRGVHTLLKIKVLNRLGFHMAELGYTVATRGQRRCVRQTRWPWARRSEPKMLLGEWCFLIDKHNCQPCLLPGIGAEQSIPHSEPALASQTRLGASLLNSNRRKETFTVLNTIVLQCQLCANAII